MTQQTAPTEQPTIEAPPVQVAPKKGSRLDDLHAAYADAKAEADKANEWLKTITDGIKVELANAAPEQTRVELVGVSGPPLRLSYVETWRLDSRKLKAEDPELYVRYAKKSGSWTLKVAGGNGGEQ